MAGSVKCAVRLPLLSLPLIALVSTVTIGAVADNLTDVETKVRANGDYEACKDLLVGVEVYDDQGHVIASCCWDGRHDALGETKVSKNCVSRTINKLAVKVTVRYKNQLLLDKDTLIRVIPGRGILIEFNGEAVRLKSNKKDDKSSTWELKEPLRVVRTIDGRTVEVTLRPGAKVESAKRWFGNQWVADFLYWVNGNVIVHDKKGDYHVNFKAHVEHAPLNLIAVITGSAAAGLPRPLADVVLRVPVSKINVHASLLCEDWRETNERVRVVFETPEGTFELGRWNYLRLTLPPEPFRVRIEVYDGERLVARSEYEIRPGPAVLHLFGPRYVQVEVTSKVTKQSPSVRFLEPEVHPGEIDIPFTLETPTGTIRYVLPVHIYAPDLLPSAEDIILQLLTFSTINLVRVLNHLLNVPDEVLNRPFTVPRLPPEYALVGLAACLTTLAARHYLGVATLATLGVDVGPEPGFATLPLGLWGARLIAAGTGLPLPLVGALAKLVQWIFDERWSHERRRYWSTPIWEVPHLVLTTPPTWYLERALREWPWLTAYLFLGAIGINLPLCLFSLPYLYSLFDEPPWEALAGLLDDIRTFILEPLSQSLPMGLANALLLLLPVLGFYLPIPDSIAALLALPSALEHLVALLLTPILLLEGTRTEFRVIVEVGPGPGGAPNLGQALQTSRPARAP